MSAWPKIDFFLLNFDFPRTEKSQSQFVWLWLFVMTNFNGHSLLQYPKWSDFWVRKHIRFSHEVQTVVEFISLFLLEKSQTFYENRNSSERYTYRSVYHDISMPQPSNEQVRPNDLSGACDVTFVTFVWIAFVFRLKLKTTLECQWCLFVNYN